MNVTRIAFGWNMRAAGRGSTKPFQKRSKIVPMHYVDLNPAPHSRNLDRGHCTLTHLLLCVRGATREGGRVNGMGLGVEDVAAGVDHALAASVTGAVDDGGDVAPVVDEVVLVEEQVEIP